METGVSTTHLAGTTTQGASAMTVRGSSDLREKVIPLLKARLGALGTLSVSSAAEFALLRHKSGEFSFRHNAYCCTFKGSYDGALVLPMQGSVPLWDEADIALGGSILCRYRRDRGGLPYETLNLVYI